MKLIKKFMKNPWVLGIGTTVIGGVLLSLVMDCIKKIDWLSTLKVVLQFIGNAIVTFLNFELKVWWVLVATALLIIALIIVSKILDIKEGINPISFLSYTKDSELGYTWEWTYTKGFDGKYTISDLHPICSKCGMRLRQGGSFGMEMECLRCHTTTEWKESYLDDARMLIKDNIRKNYLEIKGRK